MTARVPSDGEPGSGAARHGAAQQASHRPQEGGEEKGDDDRHRDLGEVGEHPQHTEHGGRDDEQPPRPLARGAHAHGYLPGRRLVRRVGVGGGLGGGSRGRRAVGADSPSLGRSAGSARPTRPDGIRRRMSSSVCRARPVS